MGRRLELVQVTRPHEDAIAGDPDQRRIIVIGALEPAPNLAKGQTLAPLGSSIPTGGNASRACVEPAWRGGVHARARLAWRLRPHSECVMSTSVPASPGAGVQQALDARTGEGEETR